MTSHIPHSIDQHDVRQRMDIGTALWVDVDFDGGPCLVKALNRLSICGEKKTMVFRCCCDTGTTTCPLESLIN